MTNPGTFYFFLKITAYLKFPGKNLTRMYTI